MKKFLSIVLVFLLIASAVPVTDVYAADVIGITTAAQLASIGTNDSYPLNGSYKLMDDISLSDYDSWTPIGASSAFSGTFEGNAKKITGLKVNYTGDNAGLFGIVSGSVKNLSVTGTVTVNVSTSETKTISAGILAGKTEWFATIDTCATSGAVTATLNSSASGGFFGGSNTVYAGGAIGNNGSMVTLSVVSHKSGAVKATCTSTGGANSTAYAGGVAGKSSSTVEDCYNVADVSATATSTKTGKAYSGGLSGYGAAHKTSYNTGDVTASGNTNSYAGAISGYTTGKSSYCYYLDGCASQAFGGYSGDTAPTATSKSSSGMNNKKLEGFDFENIWESSLVAKPKHYDKDEIITGSISILGVFQVGETLTADISALQPAEAYNGTIKKIKYEWQAGTEQTDESGNKAVVYETVSSGSGKNTYTITQNELGKYVRLVVRGTWNYGGVLESKATVVAMPAPKNVTATADSTGIKVSWNAVSGATQYTVYRSVYSEGFLGMGAGFGTFSNIGTSTTASYVDTSVESGKKYKYKVSATVNGAETDKSAETTEVTATTSGSGDSGNTDGSTSSTEGITAGTNAEIDATNKIITTELEAQTEATSLVTAESGYNLQVSNDYLGTGTEIKVTKGGTNIFGTIVGATTVATYTVVVEGDTNGDSVCDVLDCMQVEMARVGNIELTGVYLTAGDMNSDKRITISDYGTILNKAII